MSDTNPFELVPANLGPTLKEYGFEKLTSIQEAVVAADLVDRDLRISSQTGSGKTVAIGLALAKDLADAGPSERSGKAGRPQVLLIAPTRELANQLGKELSWLYRPLRKSVVVVTGGTNVGLDFRALNRNPEVLVGTPGRLFDHVKRGSVDLSQVQAVVLDEADEMLDMGFRDELQGILETTPDERHTHMVSATFPREVLALANRYQKDAITLQGANPSKANTDIAHIAHDIRMYDRLDGLINILLANPGQRTLVFVRTRVGTAEISTDLTAAGFKAFPLNGDMGQKERTSTLDAFRSGKVELLIATDVAARGLDIQGVTRIVHFDLPENPEAFTHRSGRTGRAGSKGTSICFVPPNGRRKIEYFTRAAKVKFAWEPLPGVRDIREAAERRLLHSLQLAPSGAEGDGEESEGGTEASDNTPDERLFKLAEELLAKTADPQDLVARLLQRMNINGVCEPRHIQAARPRNQRDSRDSRGGRDFRGDSRRSGTDSRDSGRHKSNSSGEGRPYQGGGRSENAEDYASFQVTWGAREGADARRMLALVCRRGQVKSRSIGAIRITDNSAMVQVRKQDATAFEKFAGQPDTRDPKIKIRPWREPKDRGKVAPKSNFREKTGMRKGFGSRASTRRHS